MSQTAVSPSSQRRLRWATASGYLALALGIAGAAMERGAPTVQAPVEEAVAFFQTWRIELRWQSFFFVLSGGVSLWFYGALRSFLTRATDEAERLATVGFTAGVIGAILQFVMQSVQVTLAMTVGSVDVGVITALGMLGFLLTVVAYIPAAVLYLAVGLATLRHRALPLWLGWYSLVTGAVHAIMSLGLVVDDGPLVPGEPLTYVLYMLALVWLPATTTAMLLRLRPRAEA